jgi:hypothetical protein
MNSGSTGRQRVVHRDGRRAAPFVALALSLAAWALPAVAQERVDKALLTIENPAAFYAQMPAVAGAMGPALEVKDKQQIPALTKRGEQLARTAYAEQPAIDEIRKAMAAAPDAGASGKDLDAVAARFRKQEAVLDAMNMDQLQKAGPGYEAKLAARADKAAIQQIANLMVAPDLAGETVLTAKRLKRVYETIIVGDAAKLMAQPKTVIDTAVSQLIDETRKAPPDTQAAPFMRELTVQSWRLRKQAVLAQLPKEDIAALLAFYTGPSGRAKRAALLNTFSARNDKAGTTVVMGLLEGAR